jgi:hypothetical protein
MAVFAVRFCWARERRADDDRPLAAGTLEVARLQASMLFATLDFAGDPPDGFQIVREGEVAYEYPEPTFH